MKISDSIKDTNGEPLEIPFSSESIAPTRYTQQNNQYSQIVNDTTTIRATNSNILENADEPFSGISSGKFEPKNTRINSNVASQDKEPAGGTEGLLDALKGTGIGLANEGLQMFTGGLLNLSSDGQLGGTAFDLANLISGNTSGNEITNFEQDMNLIMSWKDKTKKTIHIDDWDNSKPQLNPAANNTGDMNKTMVGSLGEAVTPNYSSVGKATSSLLGTIFGNRTTQSFKDIGNAFAGNTDAIDPGLDLGEIAVLNTTTKNTIYSTKPGYKPKSKSNIQSFLGSSLDDYLGNSGISIEKTRAERAERNPNYLLDEYNNGVEIKTQGEIALKNGKWKKNDTAFSGYNLSDNERRLIALIKNRNTFNTKIGYIYITNNQYGYDSKKEDSWTIPFEFNPTITEGGYTANYQSEKLLNRLGQFHVYTGTDLSTLTISTTYVALSPDDNEGLRDEFLDLNKEYGTDSWEYYWSNNRIEAIEMKLRSLVMPDLTTKSYLVRPPIIELHLTNSLGEDAEVVGDLYKYPYAYGSLGGESGRYLKVSVDLSGGDESNSRYKKYIVTNVNIEPASDASIVYPSMYGRKFQPTFANNMNPMWHITDGRVIEANQEDDGSVQKKFAGYSRIMGFKATLTCQEVTENYLDLVPDFRAYYNAWTAKENNADTLREYAQEVTNEANLFNTSLRDILLGDAKKISLSAQDPEETLQDYFEQAYNIAKKWAMSNSVHVKGKTCSAASIFPRSYYIISGDNSEGFNYNIGRYNAAIDEPRSGSAYYFANNDWITEDKKPRLNVKGENVEEMFEFQEKEISVPEEPSDFITDGLYLISNDDVKFGVNQQINNFLAENEYYLKVYIPTDGKTVYDDVIDETKYKTYGYIKDEKILFGQDIGYAKETFNPVISLLKYSNSKKYFLPSSDYEYGEEEYACSAESLLRYYVDTYGFLKTYSERVKKIDLKTDINSLEDFNFHNVENSFAFQVLSENSYKLKTPAGSPFESLLLRETNSINNIASAYMNMNQERANAKEVFDAAIEIITTQFAGKLDSAKNNSAKKKLYDNQRLVLNGIGKLVLCFAKVTKQENLFSDTKLDCISYNKSNNTYSKFSCRLEDATGMGPYCDENFDENDYKYYQDFKVQETTTFQDVENDLKTYEKAIGEAKEFFKKVKHDAPKSPGASPTKPVLKEDATDKDKAQYEKDLAKYENEKAEYDSKNEQYENEKAEHDLFEKLWSLNDSLGSDFHLEMSRLQEIDKNVLLKNIKTPGSPANYDGEYKMTPEEACIRYNKKYLYEISEIYNVFLDAKRQLFEKNAGAVLDGGKLYIFEGNSKLNYEIWNEEETQKNKDGQDVKKTFLNIYFPKEGNNEILTIKNILQSYYEAAEEVAVSCQSIATQIEEDMDFPYPTLAIDDIIEKMKTVKDSKSCEQKYQELLNSLNAMFRSCGMFVGGAKNYSRNKLRQNFQEYVNDNFSKHPLQNNYSTLDNAMSDVTYYGIASDEKDKNYVNGVFNKKIKDNSDKVYFCYKAFIDVNAIKTAHSDAITGLEASQFFNWIETKTEEQIKGDESNLTENTYGKIVYQLYKLKKYRDNIKITNSSHTLREYEKLR